MWPIEQLREFFSHKPKVTAMARVEISEKGVVHIDASELIRTNAARCQLDAAKRLDPRERSRRAAAG